jgi:uncharacterized SAM-binding protein YcdF (DUF218 family)
MTTQWGRRPRGDGMAGPRPGLLLPAAGVGLAAATVMAAAALMGVILLAWRVRRAALAAATPFSAVPGGSVARRAVAPAAAPADAIVVFGATVDADGPCAELRARLDHAVALRRAGVAPVVSVAGGVADGIDEVDAMAAYLVEQGVPPDAVEPVRPGHNTRATLESLGRMGARRYVAVSSPYHAHRIMVEGRRHGLDLSVSVPASTPETRHRPTHRARIASELAALALYALPPSWAAHVGTGPGTLRHRAPRVLAGQARARELLARGGRDA